jgi:hypothetical protein
LYRAWRVADGQTHEWCVKAHPSLLPRKAHNQIRASQGKCTSRCACPLGQASLRRIRGHVRSQSGFIMYLDINWTRLGPSCTSPDIVRQHTNASCLVISSTKCRGAEGQHKVGASNKLPQWMTDSGRKRSPKLQSFPAHYEHVLDIPQYPRRYWNMLVYTFLWMNTSCHRL